MGFIMSYLYLRRSSKFLKFDGLPSLSSENHFPHRFVQTWTPLDFQISTEIPHLIGQKPLRNKHGNLHSPQFELARSLFILVEHHSRRKCRFHRENGEWLTPYGNQRWLTVRLLEIPPFITVVFPMTSIESLGISQPYLMTPEGSPTAFRLRASLRRSCEWRDPDLWDLESKRWRTHETYWSYQIPW